MQSARRCDDPGMSLRGRGCLEIRESRDPFFMTNTSTIGLDPGRRARTYDAPAVPRAALRETDRDRGYDFSFLYEPASADIGKGIPMSGSKLAGVMLERESKGAAAFHRGRGLRPIQPADPMTLAALDPDGLSSMRQVEKQEPDADRLIASYNHAPKPEHPLYPTTANTVGIKRPSRATYVLDRRSRQQRFSNSFNGIRYRDQGLNTSMAKPRHIG